MRTGILSLFLLFIGCNLTPDEPVVIQGMTMGTNYSVTLVSERKKSVDQIKHDIEIILQSINNQMSTYIDNSELSLINQTQSSEWHPLSPELYFVISKAQEISQLTNGAYDITVGKLVNIWGFGPGDVIPSIPDDDVIDNFLQFSSYEHIELQSDPIAIKKITPDLYLDLSGIAKGYAVDRIAEYFNEQNISDYLVDIGGEIRAQGKNKDQFPWQIGVEKPLMDGREVQRIIPLINKAMATSGDYRNYIMHNGKRYSHTIDPRTGRPILHNLVSVTVLDQSAMVADALATALLVMGPEAGIDFANTNEIPVYYIQIEKDVMTEFFSEPFFSYINE